MDFFVFVVPFSKGSGVDGNVGGTYAVHDEGVESGGNAAAAVGDDPLFWGFEDSSKSFSENGDRQKCAVRVTHLVEGEVYAPGNLPRVAAVVLDLFEDGGQAGADQAGAGSAGRQSDLVDLGVPV